MCEKCGLRFFGSLRLAVEKAVANLEAEWKLSLEEIRGVLEAAGFEHEDSPLGPSEWMKYSIPGRRKDPYGEYVTFRVRGQEVLPEVHVGLRFSTTGEQKLPWVDIMAVARPDASGIFGDVLTPLINEVKVWGHFRDKLVEMREPGWVSVLRGRGCQEGGCEEPSVIGSWGYAHEVEEEVARYLYGLRPAQGNQTPLEVYLQEGSSLLAAHMAAMHLLKHGMPHKSGPARYAQGPEWDPQAPFPGREWRSWNCCQVPIIDGFELYHKIVELGAIVSLVGTCVYQRDGRLVTMFVEVANHDVCGYCGFDNGPLGEMREGNSCGQCHGA